MRGEQSTADKIAHAALAVLGDYDAVSKSAIKRGTLPRVRAVQSFQAGIAMGGASTLPKLVRGPAVGAATVFTVRKVAHITWGTGAVMLEDYDGITVDPYSDILAVLIEWAREAVKIIRRNIDIIIRASKDMISAVADEKTISTIARIGRDYADIEKGVILLASGVAFLSPLGQAALNALRRLFTYIMSTNLMASMIPYAPAAALGITTGWFVNSVGNAAERYYQDLIADYLRLHR